MGLDMYLYKETYIGANYKHREVKAKISITIKGKKIFINPKRISSIVEQVGYWRKANQIHNWFVTYPGKGVDECQRIEVSLEELRTLYELVDTALTNKDSGILEPKSGFFFGSTSIDEGYWEDLRDTRDIIGSILEESKGKEPYNVGYYYQASW